MIAISFGMVAMDRQHFPACETFRLSAIEDTYSGSKTPTDADAPSSSSRAAQRAQRIR
jgi:hypothetical protein